jgi:hypothetical protein
MLYKLIVASGLVPEADFMFAPPKKYERCKVKLME